MDAGFWQAKQTHVALNPRLPNSVAEELRRGVDEVGPDGLIWLQSSGTESRTQGLKLVGLTREAVLAAAAAVNAFLGIKQGDRWLNPLPLFHIGGLSISARCHLAGAEEILYSQAWSADSFMKRLSESQATWISLVPTQLHDLCERQDRAPEALRGVLIGGGALRSDLGERALALGWPILTSYGMTETSAAIAMAPYRVGEANPWLEPLSHVRFSTLMGGQVSLASSALFSGYLIFAEGEPVRWRPRTADFILDDVLVFNSKGHLQVLGRESELVKILGETVALPSLADRLRKILGGEVVVLAQSEARRGAQLFAFLEGSDLPLSLAKLNEQLMPFERLEALIPLPKLPRNALGKIELASLRQQLPARLSESE